MLILGPLLFNIFLADLFLVLKDVDIANFADDNTPFTSAKNIDDLIYSLEKASSSLLKCFKDNLFKSNPDKCHLLVSTNEKTKINIGEFSIESSDCEKLLEVKIDNKLTFDCHASDMCKKANRKINALARIAPFININKKRILMNSFLDPRQSRQGSYKFSHVRMSVHPYVRPRRAFLKNASFNFSET